MKAQRHQSLLWSALALLCLLMLAAPAQAQYTGGDGGGYSSGKLLLQGSASTGLQVWPNPAAPESMLSLSVSGIHSEVEWRLYDVQGRLLDRDVRWSSRNPLYLQVAMPSVEGLYVLEVRVDGLALPRQKILLR